MSSRVLPVFFSMMRDAYDAAAVTAAVNDDDLTWYPLHLNLTLANPQMKLYPSIV